MSAPFYATTDAEPTAADETAAATRLSVWQRLEKIGRLRVIAQDFLEIGDDRGAGYAIRQLIGDVRVAATIFKALPQEGPPL